MTTLIVINFEVEGIHNWPAAKDFFPEMAYLSDLHRHMFHIECTKEVTHADRDIEIVMFKREVKRYLHKYFDSVYSCCNFQSMSCEMIGAELMERFGLNSCKILEDGENGAFISL